MLNSEHGCLLLSLYIHRSVLLRREMEEKEYYFDIIRTKHEAYSHAWQLLHQVQGERARGQERGGEGEREGDGASSESAHATVTM